MKQRKAHVLSTQPSHIRSKVSYKETRKKKKQCGLDPDRSREVRNRLKTPKKVSAIGSVWYNDTNRRPQYTPADNQQKNAKKKKAGRHSGDCIYAIP